MISCHLELCQVERGTLKVGDEVELVGFGLKEKVTVTGIETFRKTLV